MSSADGVRWDLGDIFSSPKDPRIKQMTGECRRRAEEFSRRYRGSVKDAENLDPDLLLRAIRELEEIEESLSRVTSYADLVYSADTSNAEFQALEQKVEEQATEVRNEMLFFELEWMEIEESAAKRLMDHPSLKGYRHFLANLRRYRAYMLTEPEEKIVNEKDNTGRNAFGRLFSEITSSLTFHFVEGKELTLSEILALQHDPDRGIRKKAWETLYGGLAQNSQVLGFIYDTLIQDHLAMDRLRHYPDPMAARHLSNEIDGAAVEQMMEVSDSCYPMAQEYFRLKARLLKLSRIAIYDQYAPVGKETTRFPYSEARETILEAFAAFHPSFSTIAGDFFERNWIDAELRRGKRGGAFCASPSPRLHPYILCNYTDNLRDVMTVAHELGHGLHGTLSRKQSFLNYDTPLTTAESASVFGEMLVFDRLVARQSDPWEQISLLAGKIEDAFATVFRQNVLTRFEQGVFKRRREGRIPAKIIGDLWLEANGAYYGEAVEVPDDYRWGWSYIPHFIHSRFYCYSYVFGQLLVLSLYRMYKEQGRDFVPKYVALLEAGGSDSPEALLRPMGVDFHQREFWQKGFEELRSLIRRMEALVDQVLS